MTAAIPPQGKLRRAALAASLAALPLVLSGCIAAAIPVLAAGGIAKREIDNDSAEPQPEAAVDPAGESTAPEVVALPKPLPEAWPPPLPQPPAPEPEPPTAPALEAAAPSASASAQGSLIAAGAAMGSYGDFARYASAQAALDPVATPRNSAFLASAGSLQPVTQECGILPPAVIIDLDPAGSKLDSAAAFRANPELAGGLAQLRASDVAVFWISAATALEAGKVREQLHAAGLDPWGRDGLLLMRRSEDRKDLRRREVSRTHCVIAIAGDTRSDFDELFEFLRNPAAAAPLDALIGKGWFLAPPLSAPTPAPTKEPLTND